MRIAIDLIAAEYQPGGMLLVTRTLLHGLAAIDSQNEYIVMTVRPDAYQAIAKAPNIHIHPVTLPSRRGTLIQHQLIAPIALRQIKPDVLHTPAFAAPLSWRGALVTTIHDLAFIKVPEQSSLYARLYHMHLQRIGAQRAERVIVISKQTEQELIHYWSIPTQRIRLIHNGLQPSFYANALSPRAIEAMHSQYGERYLLHTGRIMPRKNVECLIEAFDLLAEKFSDLHLVLTGGLGYASAQAVQLIEASPYKARIHLAGWVPDEDMPALYAGATALVFPSKHEGQGMPTLEAMACGTPVVASNEAASIEIAGNALIRADCSSAQSLAHAIVPMLTNNELRQQLIQAGQKQAQQFRGETCAEKTLQTYQEAFGLHKQRKRLRRPGQTQPLP
jgi:glycosyltransferase involved in cell wall biosynthesis